jgi:hypothetical protein
MIGVHLIAGARDTERLVRDDRDRLELANRIHGELGPAQVSYVGMDTHVQATAIGPRGPLVAAFELALGGFVRYFNGRYDRARMALRGKVVAIDLETPFEVARTIYYDHDNPLKTKVPMVRRRIDHVWSTQRDYAGLSVPRWANVPLGLEVVGEQEWRVRGEHVMRADLAPALVPGARPEVLLGAAAQVIGILPEQVVPGAKGRGIGLARACFARLGRLEGYHDFQLAPILGVCRQRAQQLANEEGHDEAVLAARTLIVDPGLRALIRPARRLPQARNDAQRLPRSPSAVRTRS